MLLAVRILLVGDQNTFREMSESGNVGLKSKDLVLDSKLTLIKIYKRCTGSSSEPAKQRSYSTACSDLAV